MFCDNQVDIFLANNPTFYEHTEHIEINLHAIHEDHLVNSLTLLLR